ncbi:hypothetical protein Srot_1309 [Segniliparus rotundus DSM 44985]|uniref:SGNH hydrolase-type esterase domain-containing protein n=2 Tax=Segniliparus rotundus TaxID=286802 RepID=D6ZFQ3_SEGRD|nr:hypothetical protein Srot_1309 [Segniliparus rotundus DSM 44985]
MALVGSFCGVFAQADPTDPPPPPADTAAPAPAPDPAPAPAPAPSDAPVPSPAPPAETPAPAPTAEAAPPPPAETPAPDPAPAPAPAPSDAPVPSPAPPADTAAPPPPPADATAPAPDAAAANQIRKYVALGDSYASSPFQDPVDDPSGSCRRSFNNYPSQVATALNLERGNTFVDLSCSGGQSYGLTNVLPGGLGWGGQPQALTDSVTPDTDLVTMTFGLSNDTLSGVLFRDCNNGNCQAKVEGTPQLADMNEFSKRIVDSTVEGAQKIHEINPNAKIVFVGYLRMGSAWCDAWGSYNDADAAYMDSLQARVNDALKAAAAQTGSIYVDPNTHGDHGVCSEQPWVRGDGSHIGGPNFALHPTPEGQAAVAQDVLRAIGR